MLVTVDYRGGTSFGEGVSLALGLSTTLAQAGREVVLVDINAPLQKTLGRWPTEPIFCIADTFSTRSKNAEAHPERYGLRRALDKCGRLYIGSSYRGFCQSSSADKAIARRLLRPRVSVPEGVVIFRPSTVGAALRKVLHRLAPPLVIKPVRDTGASRGVSYLGQVSELATHLEEAMAEKNFPLLVERFVPGREFTAWVMDLGRGPECYGILEQRPFVGEMILTQSRKILAALEGSAGDRRVWAGVPRDEPDPMFRALCRAAVVAHRRLGLRHYSRVDMKWSGERAWVLDVNARPHITQGGLGRISRRKGEELATTLTRMVDVARAQHESRRRSMVRKDS